MNFRSAGALILGLLLMVGAVAAQEPDAMSRSEFVGLVNDKVPAADIIAQIKARGIRFEIEPELEEALQQVEGGADLLAALREPATLEVLVNVPGAQVVVDGEERGAATGGSLTVSGLAPGTHLIRATAERYVMERVDVFLKPGESGQVQVTLGTAVETKPGLLGLDVNVKAGTTEDTLMAEVERLSSVMDQETKLLQLTQDYADSPLSLLAFQMLQSNYLRQEQYDKVLEAGAQILERDAGNHQARINNVLAYVRRGELEAAFEEGGEARAVTANFDSVPQPDGVSADAWAEQKEKTAEQAESRLQKLDYDFYVKAAQTPDPAQKTAVLERFLEFYPQTQYRAYALVALAYAYQQAGNVDQALASGKRALEATPDDPAMAVLVSDILADRGQELQTAWDLATQLVEKMEADPNSVRPDGLGDEQWNRLGALWQGTAYSVLGQVLMHQETATTPAAMSKTRQAMGHFRKASPLLQAEKQLYARNLFRLGFAQAKVGDLQEAQATLNEVISLNTAYTSHAQDLLNRVNAGLQRKR
jgi:tetratricopeptide (TPR) repeat protein